MLDFVERGDDIDRQAKILGLSASAFQELSYAAKMADISQEDFAGSVSKMNKAVGELRMKEGQLYTTLAKTNPKLAFQLRDAKSSDEAFTILSSAIAKETNVQKRAVLVQAAFGKSGQALIPMFDDLNARRKEAQRSGEIISDQDVANAAAADESIKKLKGAGLSVLNQSMGALSEKLIPVLDRMTKWVAANREVISSKIISTIEGIGRAIEFITAPGVLSGLAALAIGIKAVGVASMLLGASNPLVLVVGSVAALITLIVANWDKITGFFDRMNAGGSGSGFGSTDVSTQSRSNSALEEMYGPAGASPVSPNLGAIAATSSSSTSRSIVDVNFGNAPAGTRIRQGGDPMPGSLNVGRQMNGLGLSGGAR